MVDWVNQFLMALKTGTKNNEYRESIEPYEVRVYFNDFYIDENNAQSLNYNLKFDFVDNFC